MYPKFRVSQAIVVLLALVPFAYLVRLCLIAYVDVPYWDAWEMVPRLDRMYAGTLTFFDFWGQHNEHRPILPVAILLVIARITRWDTRWEIVANFAIGIGIFAVYCAYLRTAWRAHGGAPLWLLPFVSLLLFSTAQWENWLWGWQLQLLLGALLSALTSYILAQGPRPGSLWKAIACAVGATYSFAAGLVLWPSQAAGVWIGGGPRRLIRFAVWMAAAVLVWASYFYKFARPDQPPMLSNFSSPAAIQAYAIYLCTELGAPIANYSVGVSTIAGAVAAVLFTFFAISLRDLRTDPVYLFPVCAGLQSILNAAVTGLGRTWMGLAQAQSWRYTTLTLPLWCAVLFLGTLWFRRVPLAPVRPRRVIAAVMTALLLVLLASTARTVRAGAIVASARGERNMYGRRGLLTGKSDALLLELYPHITLIRERRAVLRRLRLAVFRPAAQPSYPLPGAE